MIQMTQEEIYKVMDDYNEFMIKEAEKQEDHHRNVFKLLKKYISPYKIKKLKEYFFEEGGIDWFIEGIVGKSEVFGTKQEEEYWFKYLYCRQHTGPLGDDYTGTVFIPITEHLFLKAEYSC